MFRPLLLFLVAAAGTVGGCVSAPPPPPARPAPAPVAAPPPAPVAPPAYRGDWRDWPLTPGDWVYRQDARGSTALFGPPGGDPELTLRCDRPAASIVLARRGVASGSAPMTVRTTSAVRAVPVQVAGAAPGYLAAALSVRDTILDAMGFSRGRFVIEQAAQPTLVVPAWPEIARVVEDCRR